MKEFFIKRLDWKNVYLEIGPYEIYIGGLL